VEEKQNFEKTFNRVSRRQGEKHSNNSVMFLEIKAHPFPALKSEISTPSHSKWRKRPRFHSSMAESQSGNVRLHPHGGNTIVRWWWRLCHLWI